MKRDNDLVRRILLATEEADGRVAVEQLQTTLDVSRDELVYHIKLLRDQGYLEATILYADDMAYVVMISGLTGAGHDLLDAIRDAAIWKRVLRKLGATAAGVSLKVIEATAVGLALKSAGM